MSLKIKKNIPLIDQHDKNFMYGGKFGGNFIPETLKKPIDDLTKLFAKLRKDKKFLKERDHYFTSYVGAPTPFIKFLIFRWSLKPNWLSKLDDKSKKLTPNLQIFSTLFSEIDPANAYFEPFGSFVIKFSGNSKDFSIPGVSNNIISALVNSLYLSMVFFSLTLIALIILNPIFLISDTLLFVSDPCS